MNLLDAAGETEIQGILSLSISSLVIDYLLVPEALFQPRVLLTLCLKIHFM